MSMEHPFIGKLDDISTQELSEKTNELYQKLRIAMSSGNDHLCNQIKMAISTYEAKYQERIRQENGNDDSDYQNNVDIS